MPHILRITLHQKQGELQTVPIQPSHHVSSLAFRISGLFRISRFGFPPTCRGVLCKTNPIPATGDPDFTKRTQFTPTPAWPTIQICETNPIPAYQVSRQPRFLRNEPNFTSPTTKICETNPIFTQPSPNYAKRTQFPYRWRLAGFPRPKYAKPTQFHKAHNPKMRNEPNSHTPSVPLPPISAKRTQFDPPSSLYFTKRIQFPPPIYILQSTIYNPLPQSQPGQKPKAKSQQLLLTKRTQFTTITY